MKEENYDYFAQYLYLLLIASRKPFVDFLVSKGKSREDLEEKDFSELFSYCQEYSSGDEFHDTRFARNYAAHFSRILTKKEIKSDLNKLLDFIKAFESEVFSDYEVELQNFHSETLKLDSKKQLSVDIFRNSLIPLFECLRFVLKELQGAKSNFSWDFIKDILRNQQNKTKIKTDQYEKFEDMDILPMCYVLIGLCDNSRSITWKNLSDYCSDKPQRERLINSINKAIDARHKIIHFKKNEPEDIGSKIKDIKQLLTYLNEAGFQGEAFDRAFQKLDELLGPKTDDTKTDDTKTDDTKTDDTKTDDTKTNGKKKWLYIAGVGVVISFLLIILFIVIPPPPPPSPKNITDVIIFEPLQIDLIGKTATRIYSDSLAREAAKKVWEISGGQSEFILRSADSSRIIMSETDSAKVVERIFNIIKQSPKSTDKMPLSLDQMYGDIQSYSGRKRHNIVFVGAYPVYSTPKTGVEGVETKKKVLDTANLKFFFVRTNQARSNSFEPYFISKYQATVNIIGEK